jgi:hypothetical protein
MSELRSIDLVRNVGQVFISNPLLFGSEIVYVTRQGVGHVIVAASLPTNSREVFYRKTGLLAYKLFFLGAATEQEKIHVIYKI